MKTIITHSSPFQPQLLSHYKNLPQNSKSTSYPSLLSPSNNATKISRVIIFEETKAFPPKREGEKKTKRNKRDFSLTNPSCTTLPAWLEILKISITFFDHPKSGKKDRIFKKFLPRENWLEFSTNHRNWSKILITSFRWSKFWTTF